MAKKKPVVAASPAAIPPELLGAITQGDCVPLLARLPDGGIPLVVADPPYNISYHYDAYDDTRSAADYLEWCRIWLAQVFRVLSPTGTFWLIIGDRYVSELDVLCKTLGFQARSKVCWYFTFGQNATRNFTPSHTNLLYYTRSRSAFTFNDLAVRVPSARQLVYNDKRADPRGRLPDDTWILRPQEPGAGFTEDLDTWHVPRVCGTYKEKAGTPNQIPEQLLARIIRATSNPGEIVLDPMCGSGSTLATAKKLGRQFLGFELSADYRDKAMARVQAAQPGAMLDPPISQEPASA